MFGTYSERVQNVFGACSGHVQGVFGACLGVRCVFFVKSCVQISNFQFLRLPLPRAVAFRRPKPCKPLKAEATARGSGDRKNCVLLFTYVYEYILWSHVYRDAVMYSDAALVLLLEV